MLVKAIEPSPKILALRLAALLPFVQPLVVSQGSTAMGGDGQEQIQVRQDARHVSRMGMLHGEQATTGTSTRQGGHNTRGQSARGRLSGMAQVNSDGLDVRLQVGPSHPCL